MEGENLEALNMSGLGAVQVEEEMGRVRTAFPRANPNQQTAMAANNIAVKAHKRSLLTRAMQYLIIVATQLTQDARNAIRDGLGRWEETDLYIRKEVTAGNGIQPLLKSGDKEVVGVTNINSNRLPKGTNVAVDRVRIAFGKHATVIDASKIAYSNTDATTDAGILNGEIRIEVGDKPVLKLPLAGFFNIAGAYAAIQGNLDVKILGRPFLIKEDTPINVSIQLADGSTLATAHTFLEVRMMGAALITG